MASIDLLIFIEGIGHCVQDSHLYLVVIRLVFSITPPPLHRLDKTGHHFAPAGYTDRPFQEQV
jgi:hypothetical protein